MTAYPLGTRVRKTKGSSWQGHVVGHYSTSLTADGVCVESEREPGSVQLYPVAALEPVPDVDTGQIRNVRRAALDEMAAEPRPTGPSGFIHTRGPKEGQPITDEEQGR